MTSGKLKIVIKFNMIICPTPRKFKNCKSLRRRIRYRLLLEATDLSVPAFSTNWTNKLSLKQLKMVPCWLTQASTILGIYNPIIIFDKLIIHRFIDSQRERYCPLVDILDSERSEECIDFTMIITSRNNAPISNYGGGFRCKSEYPWCIIEVKS
ncbi:Uncharacterized protein FWK35_00014229 [Aphis craccivora]|uniref:Uncharacterized protein n=1 Tax=Aphis craccivora TaxID=307492 RepID=A0A6G0YJ52_APHCR|nr:Uncharacterized protein FWK35_00014229 [Aphis craccivora]